MKQPQIIYKTKDLAIVRELPNHAQYWQHWPRKDKSDMVWVVDGQHHTFRAYRKVRIVKDESSLLARMFGERDQYYDIYVPLRTTVDN